VKISARKVLPWQLIECFTRYRQFIALLFGLSIFCIALVVCWHLLETINLNDLQSALQQLPYHENSLLTYYWYVIDYPNIY